MKYVAIKHKPEHTNVWWFYVPEGLEDKVRIGDEVVCETQKGEASGKVMYTIEGFSRDEIKKIVGVYPSSRIVAVYADLPINEIYIPIDFSANYIEAEKIARRVTEFYTTGGFNTPVIISSNGKLRDGYTAYLVAKMFEHDTLRCLRTLD